MSARYFVRVTHGSGSPTVSTITTKTNCIYFAQSVCSNQGDRAEVVKEKRGGDVVIMRYWRDSEGLQFLEY